MQYQSINPVTNEVLRSFPLHSFDEADVLLKQSEAAFAEWRKKDFEARGQCLLNLATQLTKHMDELAYICTLEMGKPLAEAKRELDKSILNCRFFAARAAEMLQPEQLPGAPVQHQVFYEPMGTIFGIFPWNFPYWQVIRFAAPALMAGNVVAVKHAPNVPQCAQLLQQLFDAAGFPKGVYTNLLLDNETAAQVIAHPAVKGVSLTGSEVAGSAVAAQAGKHIKPSVLELGGSDALIVLGDADFDLAIRTGVQSRFINSGQACNAAKRFIVPEEHAEVFTQKLLDVAKTYRCVDPMQESGIGPLARKDLLLKLEQQVNDTVQMGAKVLLGGKRVGGPGNYFEPSVLTNIPKGSPAYTEELFGPVISLFVVKTEAEAIALANDTRFGLDAGIFTQDMEKAKQMAAQLDVAQVFINSLTRSMPELPFGGSKKSGYGRELSLIGIREFVNVKTVVF